MEGVTAIVFADVSGAAHRLSYSVLDGARVVTISCGSLEALRSRPISTVTPAGPSTVGEPPECSLGLSSDSTIAGTSRSLRVTMPIGDMLSLTTTRWRAPS